MTTLPPDAGSVCVALDLDAGYLADVFRREATIALRKLAQHIEADGTAIVAKAEHAAHLLMIVEAFEAEWESQEKDDGAVRRNGGDSPTPTPLPSCEGTLA